ncbi:MAG: hypothetical protein A2Y82_05190 [Candidatus Buchananbacteria bacterium RBG_13_36_9]|uniref:Gluconeogenesis factor n=1 Tax=Candidatus Buchananbacteria bacterium RBG_13_36_9 TaxID=1797530 RepID=A0A1G1XPR1_9BACT|nr:MAG: hypothetical protein A2Y82_05190 [Candidatus Buchananbacteria bacterium RBG_13_36_9]
MSKVTFIGGGTGPYGLLGALKSHPDLDLAVIVTMFDDGGSTGTLRDELGALPPGDVRQCLVALSEESEDWRGIFDFRWSEGEGLKGHSLGNLIITALEKKYKSFEKALEVAKRILKVRGDVIPVTLDNIRLVAQTPIGKRIIGEHNIDLKEQPIKSLSFRPEPSVNPKAIERILKSDLIVICPGDLYTSILPNLMVQSMANAIGVSNALKVYVCNLMTQKMHTEGFRVIHFVELLEKYLGQKDIFDFVLYNTKKPSQKFLASYLQEGESPVRYLRKDFANRRTEFIGQNFLSQKMPQKVEGDSLKRALIRHNAIEVALVLKKLLKKRE